MKKIFYSLVAITLLVAPVAVFAQLGPGQGGVPDVGQIVPNKQQNDLFVTLNNIANIMLAVLIALAVLFVLYAAFQYLFSGGDEKKIGSAKNAIVYALVAVAVGLLAKGLVAVIRSIAAGL